MGEIVKHNKRSSKIFKLFLTKRFMTIILVLLLLGTLIMGVSKFVSSEGKTTKIGFEDIGELVTQAAYCTEVNVTNADRKLFTLSIPFTESKYIYSYDVIVKAGLDFGQIKWDVKDSTIKVKLPEIKITDCDIDPKSFQLYHEDESIFRQITLEENNAAIANLEEQAEKDAIANGLLDNARSNAEVILRGFFGNAYDLDKYEIEFNE